MPRRSIRRFVIWITIVTAILCVSTGEFLILQSPVFDQHNTNTSEKQNTDKYKSCRPIPVLTLAWVPIRTRICVGFFRNLRFFDAYHDTINALSTLLVAIFTFTLWRTTSDLFISAQADRDLSERTAKQELRAYIGISKIHVVEWSHYKRIKINYVITNFGQTPARNEIFNYIVIGWDKDRLPIKPDDEGPLSVKAPVNIMPGGCDSNDIQSFELTSTEEILYEQSRLMVWVIGRIDYEDVFGIKQTTSVRMLCFPKEHDFVLDDHGNDAT